MIKVRFTKISNDDWIWAVTTDLEGLQAFLAEPRGFAMSNGGIALSDSYPITLSDECQEQADAVTISGVVHIQGESRLVSSVKAVINKPLIAREARLLLGIRSAGHSIASLTTSRWDQVRTDFPSPINISLLYRKSTASGGNGKVYPHFDLHDNQDKLANFISAMFFEPVGLGPWIEEQVVAKRQEILQDDSVIPLERPPRTREYFSSDNRSLTIELLGRDPRREPCPPGFHLIACNAITGTFIGDPILEDSDIDLGIVSVKWYCIEDKP